MNFKNQNLLFVSIHNKSLLKNFQESVEKPISTKKLHGFNLQNSILKRKNIAVWSLVNTEENYKIWSSIKKSDRIMFLRDKKFFSKGNVIATIDNINLSKKIWKDIPFIEKRNMLIFLDGIQSVELELDACIPTLIEPIMPNAYFFPIKKIDRKKRDLLVTSFGNLDNAINFLANPESKNIPISDYLSPEQISEETQIVLKTGSAKQRVGQQKFRKNILANFGYKCAVCKISDVDLLAAAHIIPVDDNNLAGKTNNGICLCVLCHKMFDFGFFSFDERYNVVTSKHKKISKKLLKTLENQKIGICKILPSQDLLSLHRTKFGIAYKNQ